MLGSHLDDNLQKVIGGMPYRAKSRSSGFGFASASRSQCKAWTMRIAGRPAQKSLLGAVRRKVIVCLPMWIGRRRASVCTTIYVSSEDAPSYEEIREHVTNRRFKIRTSPADHLRTELKAFEGLLPTFFDRKWTLFKACAKSTGFITSDHPLCLMWSEPKRQSAFYGPGFGLPNTTVFFPIANELAIAGAFEAEERVIDPEPWQIAAINGATIHSSERQVYAREGDFIYTMRPDEKIKNGPDLLRDARFALATKR